MECGHPGTLVDVVSKSFLEVIYVAQKIENTVQPAFFFLFGFHASALRRRPRSVVDGFVDRGSSGCRPRWSWVSVQRCSWCPWRFSPHPRRFEHVNPCLIRLASESDRIAFLFLSLTLSFFFLVALTTFTFNFHCVVAKKKPFETMDRQVFFDWKRLWNFILIRWWELETSESETKLLKEDQSPRVQKERKPT